MFTQHHVPVRSFTTTLAATSTLTSSPFHRRDNILPPAPGKRRRRVVLTRPVLTGPRYPFQTSCRDGLAVEMAVKLMP